MRSVLLFRLLLLLSYVYFTYFIATFEYSKKVYSTLTFEMLKSYIYTRNIPDVPYNTLHSFSKSTLDMITTIIIFILFCFVFFIVLNTIDLRFYKKTNFKQFFRPNDFNYFKFFLLGYHYV